MQGHHVGKYLVERAQQLIEYKHREFAVVFRTDLQSSEAWDGLMHSYSQPNSAKTSVDAQLAMSMTSWANMTAPNELLKHKPIQQKQEDLAMETAKDEKGYYIVYEYINRGKNDPDDGRYFPIFWLEDFHLGRKMIEYLPETFRACDSAKNFPLHLVPGAHAQPQWDRQIDELDKGHGDAQDQATFRVLKGLANAISYFDIENDEEFQEQRLKEEMTDPKDESDRNTYYLAYRAAGDPKKKLRPLCWGPLFGETAEDAQKYLKDVLILRDHFGFPWAESFEVIKCMTRGERKTVENSFSLLQKELFHPDRDRELSYYDGQSLTSGWMIISRLGGGRRRHPDEEPYTHYITYKPTAGKHRGTVMPMRRVNGQAVAVALLGKIKSQLSRWSFMEDPNIVPAGSVSNPHIWDVFVRVFSDAHYSEEDKSIEHEAYSSMERWEEEIIASTLNATSSDVIRLVLNDRLTIATLDGTPYEVTASAGRILKMLIDADGDWVSGSDMKVDPDSGERPDMIVARMPESIRALIESRRGGGFRIPRRSLHASPAASV